MVNLNVKSVFGYRLFAENWKLITENDVTK